MHEHHISCYTCLFFLAFYNAPPHDRLYSVRDIFEKKKQVIIMESNSHMRQIGMNVNRWFFLVAIYDIRMLLL